MESEMVFAIGVPLDFEVTLQMFDLWLEWRCVVLVNEC